MLALLSNFRSRQNCHAHQVYAYCSLVRLDGFTHWLLCMPQSGGWQQMQLCKAVLLHCCWDSPSYPANTNIQTGILVWAILAVIKKYSLSLFMHPVGFIQLIYGDIRRPVYSINGPWEWTMFNVLSADITSTRSMSVFFFMHPCKQDQF